MHNHAPQPDFPDPAAIERALAISLEHVQFLPLDRLVVDHEHYQRDEHAKQVLEMAQAFDVSSFGLVIVSQRGDGSYAVIDGQRRCGSLRLIGVRFAPCLVVETPALRDEARAFLGLNVHRSRVAKYETFQAQLTSGSSLHLGIAAALARHGLAVGRKDGLRIRCVGALEQIAATSFDLLDRVITLALEGYGRVDGALTGTHLLGLYFFLLLHKDEGFAREHLLRVIEQNNPQATYLMAKSEQNAWRGRLEVNIARALTAAYNKHIVRREDKLATPWLSGKPEGYLPTPGGPR
jgi:hypothetical protein